MKKIITLFAALSLLSLLGGCAPALVAGGAAGGYAVAKDKGAVGTYTDDSWITTKVKSKVTGVPGVNPLNVSVATNQGNVVLTGTVPNKTAWKRAVYRAWHTKGVKSVDASNLKYGQYKK